MASHWHIRKQKEGPESGIAIRMGLQLVSFSTGSTAGLPSPFCRSSCHFLSPAHAITTASTALPSATLMVWPLLPTHNAMVPPTSYSLFVLAQPDRVSFILESDAHTSIHLLQEGNGSLCSMLPFPPSYRSSSGVVVLRPWASLPQSSWPPLSSRRS